MKWMKTASIRGLQSFLYAVTINLVLEVIVTAVVNKPDFIPVLPDFAAYFSSPFLAFGVQCILVGLTSMAFGAGSVIMEFASWSLVKQSVIYFLVTATVWIPVSVFCWGLGKYKNTFYSITASYLIGYIISWSVQYKVCKKNISDINRKLEELNKRDGTA